MAITRYKVSKLPGQSQFGLDQFTESWKCFETADVVLLAADVPQRGDAHPDYAFMFCTDRHCNETGESSSLLDLVYTGCLASSEGLPTLPPQAREKDVQVMSASSSRSSGGATLNAPITVQFYAPTNSSSFLTYNAIGDVSGVSDPTDDIQVITLQVGDTSYVPGGLIDDLVAAFFSSRIVNSLTSTEIVSSGKFYQNQAKKTKCLVPFPFHAAAGDYIVMFSPGQGYSVSDSLTMSDGMGHSATITVTSLGIGGSILSFSVSGNSFNYTTSTPIYTSGGSGTGAAFYNYHLT